MSSETSASPAIECQNLSRVYEQGNEKLTVLSRLNLAINQHERVAIVGTSGSGKSTLLHLLGGLDKATSGSVSLAGHDIGKMSEKRRGQLRNKEVGFIYQFHHLLPEFSALENVCMPLLIGGERVSSAEQTAQDILQRVGLEQRLKHKPSELSGGERQRVAVARALVTRPTVVLADEPTGNLDHHTADQVFEMMLELNRETGTSLLVVTHDLALAKRMDRVLELVDGILLEQ